MAESEALVTLIRQGWATENPAFRQTMTSIFMPDASREEADWFNEFQKTCGPAENIARFREMFDEMDVSEAMSIMNENRIRHLPVLNEQGEIEGMISLRYLHHDRMEDLFSELSSLNAYYPADGPGG